LQLGCAGAFAGGIDLSYLECVTQQLQAQRLRVAGWMNAALTFILALGVASDSLMVYGAGAVWASLVMGVTHAAAYLIEHKGSRAVTA
jgi:hypothetical protein